QLPVACSDGDEVRVGMTAAPASAEADALVRPTASAAPMVTPGSAKSNSAPPDAGRRGPPERHTTVTPLLPTIDMSRSEEAAVSRRRGQGASRRFVVFGACPISGHD